MSFILDALKKAESLRGQAPPVATPEGQFSDMAQPVRETTVKPVWIGVIGGAVIMIAGLVWWLGRSEAPILAASATQASVPAVNLPLPGDDSQREIRPLDSEVRRGAPEPVVSPTPRVKPGTVEVSLTPLSRDNVHRPTSAPEQLASSRSNTEQLPSYQSLALSGRTSLPPFHLDIHVDAPQAQRRFVFINNRKYREGEQLEEGGSVERITQRGVVLNYRGHRFELLPD